MRSKQKNLLIPCFPNLKICGGIFDLENQEKELDDIESIMSDNDFWQKDQSEIQKMTQRRSILNDGIGLWRRLYKDCNDNLELIVLAVEEQDEQTFKEVCSSLNVLEKEINDLELQSLLGKPDDKRNAIVAINAGAGGTEAQDWTEMLLRMYTRWCEVKGMKAEIMDYLPGDDAGIKNVTFSVEGQFAYGYLKSEHGIHRLVRVSPFDASGRRHTSFASVSVLPEVDMDINIEVEEKDIRVDTFRASGPGGQHVNKTSSAIRITHFPSGIVVQCQNEKSQHRNRDMAMKMLKARLYDLERRKMDQQKQDMHQNQKDIAWGSQIRSYVFMPYRLVKDHRTNVDVGDVDYVMGGGLDPFIDAFLRMK